jgi:hypothetical protein
MSKVKELRWDSTDICVLNDIDFQEYISKNNKIVNRNNISICNRLFAYQTKNNKFKLVFDLMKDPTLVDKRCKTCNAVCISCSANKLIDDWNYIYAENINGILKDDEFFNLEFHPRPSDTMTFFSKNKIINVELPCLDKIYPIDLSEEELENRINRIRKPIFKIINDIQVDFYRWNPINPNIILIISGSLIIMWNLKEDAEKENKSIQKDLNSKGEFKGLQLVVVDAQWNADGDFLTVTSKCSNQLLEDFYLSIIFDIELNSLALINEARSQKVLILESKNNNNYLNFQVFTCGKRKCNKHKNKSQIIDFKFGMYSIEKKNEVIRFLNHLIIIKIFKILIFYFRKRL